MKLCYQHKERVCTEKEEEVSIVKGGERRGTQVHIKTIEERVY